MFFLYYIIFVLCGFYLYRCYIYDYVKFCWKVLGCVYMSWYFFVVILFIEIFVCIFLMFLVVLLLLLFCLLLFLIFIGL